LGIYGICRSAKKDERELKIAMTHCTLLPNPTCVSFMLVAENKKKGFRIHLESRAASVHPLPVHLYASRLDDDDKRRNR
jgi:hypothetical protein